MGSVGVAQGVARGRVLEADQGDDVAGVSHVSGLAMVGVHLDDAADPLLAVLGGVEYGVALADHARIDAGEDELAQVHVGHDLEGQRGKGLLVVRPPLQLELALHVQALRGGDVEGAGQVIDDGVEHGLDAFVLEGGAAQDRDRQIGDGGAPQGGPEVVGGDLLVVEELLGDPVVEGGDGVDQGVTRLDGLFFQAVRDLDDVELLTPGRAVLPDQGLHFQQVDHPDEVALDAYGELDNGDGDAQAVLDHVDTATEIGPDPVHLVYETDTRHAVLVRLPPHRFGLRLDSGHGVEHGYGTVEDAQGPLHFDGEVDMAGGVDDVDEVVVPMAGGGRRGDRDAPFLFLGHPVHSGTAFVDLTQLVVDPRVVQDPLGRRGLARVDMGHDPDVAGPGQRGTLFVPQPLPFACLNVLLLVVFAGPEAPRRAALVYIVLLSVPVESRGSPLYPDILLRGSLGYRPSRRPTRPGQPRRLGRLRAGFELCFQLTDMPPEGPACSVTSGSGRRPGWSQPSCACLPDASQRHQGR